MRSLGFFIALVPQLIWGIEVPGPTQAPCGATQEAQSLSAIFERASQCQENSDKTSLNLAPRIPTPSSDGFDGQEYERLNQRAQEVWSGLLTCAGQDAFKARHFAWDGISGCAQGNRLGQELKHFTESVLAFAESSEIRDHNGNWIGDRVEAEPSQPIPAPHSLFSQILVRELARHQSMYQEYEWVQHIIGAEERVRSKAAKEDFISRQFLSNNYAGFRRISWIIKFFSSMEPADCYSYGFFPLASQVVLLLVGQSNGILSYGPNYAYGIQKSLIEAKRNGMRSANSIGWKSYLIPHLQACGGVLPTDHNYTTFERDRNIFVRSPEEVMRAVRRLKF